MAISTVPSTLGDAPASSASTVPQHCHLTCAIAALLRSPFTPHS